MLRIRQRVLALDTGSEEIEFQQTLFTSQVKSVVILASIAVFVGIVEWIWPSFYTHPNLSFKLELGTMGRFWPLFAYAGILGVIVYRNAERTQRAGQILRNSITISVLAGIWEELAFRWLLVCTAMIGIAFLNWLLGTFFGSIIGIGICLLGGYLFFAIEGVGGKIAGILIALFGGWLLHIIWVGGHDSPIYWIQSNIIVPLVNLGTLNQLKSVTANPALSSLFVFGLISANAAFRDGHKYQGLFGLVNSWYIGCVLMHAAVTYGLGTAIVLHALYDIECGVVKYSVRSLSSD